MTHVTFEQAKWLKEIGFNVPCFYYYENGKLVEPYLENGSSTDVEFRVDLSDLLEHFNKWSQRVSAPEQWQVIEWLRVNHGIWISISPSISKKFEYIIYIKDMIISSGKYSSDFSSPQEAYSAAFDYIKKEGLI
jgi:hypothetical protein